MTTTTNYKPNYSKSVTDLTEQEYRTWRVPAGDAKENYKSVRVHYKKNGELLRVVSEELTETAKAANEKSQQEAADYMEYLRVISGTGKKGIGYYSADEIRRVVWEKK